MPGTYWANFAGDRILDYILKGPIWVAAHLADPTPLGLLPTELSGGGYKRDSIEFSKAAAKSVVNSVDFSFNALPAAKITYLALWGAISAGDMYLAYQLPNTLVVPASGFVSVAKGNWAIQL